MQDNRIMVIRDGEKIFVNSLDEAQTIADREGLDLVNVAPNVYKIMDYKKHLYDTKKNAKQQKKQAVKEAQFNFGIAENDLRRKIRDIKRWLIDGCMVRCTIKLHGREASRPELVQYIVDAVISSVTEEKLTSEKPLVKRIDGAYKDILIVMKPARK